MNNSMPNNNSYEKRTLDLPDDTTLPFFAYGIFKPGQLAHSKIKNHVSEYEKDAEIHYPMKARDGVPILIDKEKDYHLTRGCIITFKQGKEKTAYEIICKTILKKLYEWKTIRIDGNDVNVLFGLNPDYGSNIIEYPEDRLSYNGKRDPLFSEALELIEKNLSSDNHHRKEVAFFELQMNYMLLWSAIDRYTTLKYNKRLQKYNNERFAKEKAFKDGIMKFKDKHHQPVYSTDDLKIHEFNVENPYETLLYYYTFRCNVVHRGKSARSEYSMLKQATEELLEIFNGVIDDTFDKSNPIQK